ncbi:zinc finger protein 583-like isoform X2 [Plodia interpunctella]|nr:zinc finger protein 583-like isoform X2 [Plodia interpunctella]
MKKKFARRAQLNEKKLKTATMSQTKTQQNGSEEYLPDQECQDTGIDNSNEESMEYTRSQPPQHLNITTEVKVECDPECSVPVTGDMFPCIVKVEPKDEEEYGQASACHTSIENIVVKCEFEYDSEDQQLPTNYLHQQYKEDIEPVQEGIAGSSSAHQSPPNDVKTEPPDYNEGATDRETDSEIRNQSFNESTTNIRETETESTACGDRSSESGGTPKSESKLAKRKAERGRSGKKPRKRRDPTQADEKPHECDTCHKRFKELCHLIAHYSAHTEEKLHICNICQRQFTRRSNLKTHLRMHTGESLYTCKLCPSRFTNKSKLELHLKRHTGEKPFDCDLCKSRFADKCTLKRHIRTHTGEKPFECSVCHNRFAERTSLHAHYIVHTGEKPYKCDFCAKLFSRKGNLQTHVRTHTGEKPYECNICKTRFTERSTLIRHVRTHTGEKPYECSVCLSRFTLMTKLKRHLKKHTSD